MRVSQASAKPCLKTGTGTLPVPHGAMVVVHVLSAAILGTILAGCSAPVLSIKHVLPAALPLQAEIAPAQAKDFVVSPATEQDMASFVAQAVNDRLFGSDGATSRPAMGDSLVVAGAIDIESTDRAGQRDIRRWNSDAAQYETRPEPFLVRTTKVGIDFAIKRRGGVKPMVTIETRRTHRSNEDPRLRGELGLGRGDDPQRVPPTEQVVRELLAECVETFIQMVQPVEVTAQVQLRETLQRQGLAGLEAVRKGDSAAAMKLFAAAVAADPNDPDLLFNLAAAQEAAGDLEPALANYRKAGQQQAADGDATTEAAARRVEGVLAKRRALTAQKFTAE